MVDFNQIFTDIKNQLGPLAEENLQELASQGKQDAEAFLAQSRADLEKWIQQLANGDINQAEFNVLVGTRKAAAKMTALQAASAGQVQIDQFRDSVFNVVVKTAVAAVTKQV